MKKILPLLFILTLLKPLTHSSTLDRVADCRISYMQQNNLWSHSGWHRCFYMHGVYGHRGEVLARGFNSDEATVNAWRNSPSHNRVINQPWWFVGYAKRDGYTVVTFSR